MRSSMLDVERLRPYEAPVNPHNFPILFVTLLSTGVALMAFFFV